MGQNAFSPPSTYRGMCAHTPWRPARVPLAPGPAKLKEKSMKTGRQTRNRLARPIVGDDVRRLCYGFSPPGAIPGLKASWPRRLLSQPALRLPLSNSNSPEPIAPNRTQSRLIAPKSLAPQTPILHHSLTPPLHPWPPPICSQLHPFADKPAPSASGTFVESALPATLAANSAKLHLLKVKNSRSKLPSAKETVSPKPQLPFPVPVVAPIRTTLHHFALLCSDFETPPGAAGGIPHRPRNRNRSGSLQPLSNPPSAIGALFHASRLCQLPVPRFPEISRDGPSEIFRDPLSSSSRQISPNLGKSREFSPFFTPRSLWPWPAPPAHPIPS